MVGSASPYAPLIVSSSSLALFHRLVCRAIVLTDLQSHGVRPLSTGSHPPKTTSAPVLHQFVAPLPRVRATITKCIERGMESAEWY